jgi:hypothetical protein
MDKPEPISEEKIKKINKVIKDMVFTYKGPVSEYNNGEFQYQISISGQKHMISVGEYYNYLIMDVVIIDGSPMTTLFIKYLPYILSDYKTLNYLSREISEELQYFFGVEYVRVVYSDGKIKVSEEYQQKIDNTEPEQVLNSI